MYIDIYVYIQYIMNYYYIHGNSEQDVGKSFEPNNKAVIFSY